MKFAVLLTAFVLLLSQNSYSQDFPELGCYYTDPVIKERADWVFDQALALRQGKAVSWDKFKEFYNSENYGTSQKLYSEAVSLGNPRAFLHQCYALTDKDGPPSAYDAGLAWCQMGLNVVGEMDVQIKKELEKRIEFVNTNYTDIDQGMVEVFKIRVTKKIRCK